MGVKFRKSINLGGGVKLNVGKKSVGLSAGVKGARVSVNSSGRKTTTVGIPGTGVSYISTTSLNNKSNANKTLNNNTNNIEITEAFILKRYNQYKLISNILFISGAIEIVSSVLVGPYLFLLAIVSIGVGILSKIISICLKSKIR